MIKLHCEEVTYCRLNDCQLRSKVDSTDAIYKHEGGTQVEKKNDEDKGSEGMEKPGTAWSQFNQKLQLVCMWAANKRTYSLVWKKDSKNWTP